MSSLRLLTAHCSWLIAKERMSKEDAIEVMAVVLEPLPIAMFRVVLDN